jgi:hypothetical protein
MTRETYLGLDFMNSAYEPEAEDEAGSAQGPPDVVAIIVMPEDCRLFDRWFSAGSALASAPCPTSLNC